MIGKRSCWLTIMAFWLALSAPATTLAGEFIGEWGCCWRPSRDCPRGVYSPLHYWTPELYRVNDCIHRANLDEYPPGPSSPVPLIFEIRKHCCPTAPPAPTSPYADPATYYGRVIAPQ